jgi:hypothetical protein
MKIDELIERISKLWNGSIWIQTKKTKDEYIYLIVKNGKIITQSGSDTYDFLKKYDWKIYSYELMINPILNGELITITLRPLSEFEKELGDRGW